MNDENGEEPLPDAIEEIPDDGDEGDGGEEEEDAARLPLPAIVEAVLFAAREPLKLQNIARAVGKRIRQETVKEAIDDLNVQYLESGRAFEIAEISGRYQLMSRPEFVEHIVRIYPKKDLAEKEKAARLTPSALDTLSIIAYKQPVTRADVERVRGCGCGTVLRALIERGSVKVLGKSTELTGQPLLYGTTEAFLAEFGLGSVEELPMRNEILGMLNDGPAPSFGEADEAGENDEVDEADEDDEDDDGEAGEEEEVLFEYREESLSEHTVPPEDV